MSEVTHGDATHTVRVIEERLRESMPTGGAFERTAALIYELLLIAHRHESELRTGVRIKHSIEHVNGNDTLMLEIKHLTSFTWTALQAMQRVANGALLDVTFRFHSPQTLEPLSSGRLSVALDIGGDGGGTEADTRRRERRPVSVYVEPQRSEWRARVQRIDWSGSVVASDDRALVEELLDDVFHMHATMPAHMQASLEPIQNADYVQRCSSAKRKRGNGNAVESDESATSDGKSGSVRTVGYAVHFAGVPTFSHSFLEHLAQKYDSRWLGATVLFPHKRAALRAGSRGAQVETRLVAPELVISLACAAKEKPFAKAYAVRGARQLCKKLCT